MYEKAIIINELIGKYKEQIQILEKILREFKQPEPIYTYSVSEMPVDMWNTIPGSIRITGTLVNKADFDLFLNSVGFILNPPKETIRSVAYFRTYEGILTHQGGGYMLLKDACLCTDEEWEEIKKGNFAKFSKDCFFK